MYWDLHLVHLADKVASLVTRLCGLPKPYS